LLIWSSDLQSASIPSNKTSKWWQKLCIPTPMLHPGSDLVVAVSCEIASMYDNWSKTFRIPMQEDPAEYHLSITYSLGILQLTKNLYHLIHPASHHHMQGLHSVNHHCQHFFQNPLHSGPRDPESLSQLHVPLVLIHHLNSLKPCSVLCKQLQKFTLWLSFSFWPFCNFITKGFHASV
jgi:hypothetical protein